jgi:hypothetical protein
MNTSPLPPYRGGFDWKPAPGSVAASSFNVRKSGDPSIVALSAGEMQRLIDIERSAEAALAAIRAIRSPDQRVTDAASALAIALADPAPGG